MNQNINAYRTNRTTQYAKAAVIDRNAERRAMRRRIARRNRILALLALTLGIILSITLFVNFANAKDVNPSYKYYTSIQVKSGDTLWQIAEEYMTDEYRTKNDYMEEVMRLNHMVDTNVTAGQYLTIPYYSAEVK